MANRHSLKRAVPVDLGRVPVQFFPVVTEHLSQRIARWQRYTYSVASFATGFRGIDEVVLVAIVHGAKVYRNISCGHHDLQPPRDLTSQATAS